jgi:hypothetical protein
MTNMRKPPVDLGPDVEVPEADAAEQRADVVDITDDSELAPNEQLDALRGWDAEAIDPSDERVVALDDDDYR